MKVQILLHGNVLREDRTPGRVHTPCHELQGQGLPRALWKVSDLGTRTYSHCRGHKSASLRLKGITEPICSLLLSFSTLLSKLSSPSLLSGYKDSPRASSARSGCDTVRPHVTAAPTIRRALRVRTLQTVCIPHARTMATGGRRKVPVISKDRTCQQNVEEPKKPFPNMETGVDRFGAHGSFGQFFILPVSLADFSTTQHRTKGNKNFYFQYFGALEMIKAFSKK